MYRYLILSLAVALVPGCDLLFPPQDSPPGGSSTGDASLKAFESEEELGEYLAEQITAQNNQWAAPGGGFTRDEEPAFDSADGDASTAGPSAPEAPTDSNGTAGAPPAAEPSDGGTAQGEDAASTGGEFSETTIQEAGVDEADVVKTDGTHLYIINGETLHIVQASPAAQLAALSDVSLEGHGREIYLHNNKVVAITETYGGPVLLEGGVADTDVAVSDEGVAEATIAIDWRYERPQTIVTVIDATTPSSPTVASVTSFDGSAASSRMINGMLYLVLANYQDYYFDVLPMLGQPELDVAEADVETLLPGFERVNGDEPVSSGSVITWRELYHPVEPAGFGVVTVVSMDVDNSTEFKAVGVVAEPGLIYSSLNALYLTDTDYDFTGDQRETTKIHKLAYADGGTTPVASGAVQGRILNQYSMGEYGGYLRVATTIQPGFSEFDEWTEPYSNVYVLNEVEGELKVVGSVENIAPGEEIKAARFVGTRGFVVTFEQIDPLHTLDLSDPTAPRIVGELKVPGYSTFVVPMDADHLLTVGQYIPEEGPFFNWGVQLSIFDISDFSNPLLKHSAIIGQMTGASSEALHNPKAFTYFSEANLVALPISIYEEFFFEDIGVVVDEEGEADMTPDDPGVDEEPPVGDQPPPDEPILVEPEPFVPQGFEGLAVYRVTTDEGFSELGRLSTRFEEAGYYWSSFTRGVFIGEEVFAVTDHGVRAAPLTDIASAPYQLMLQSSNGDPDGASGFVGDSSTGEATGTEPAEPPVGG
jgi:hypothetical protein